MKPRAAQITESLVDVLKDFDCSLDEAKRLLADAYNDYDGQMEDAWRRQQESLMEDGGRDDSNYRQDLINAGRGHLLR
jgi:hypothetical protein